jgi:hypothetical protein
VQTDWITLSEISSVQYNELHFIPDLNEVILKRTIAREFVVRVQGPTQYFHVLTQVTFFFGGVGLNPLRSLARSIRFV